MSWFCCGSSQMKSNSTIRESQPENQEPDNKQGEVGISTRTFSFQELANATENFSSECCVNVSSFGKVYKGQLEGTLEIVAVEKMDMNGTSRPRDFLVEILMLSLLNHPNLISLVGYCAETDEKILVREYMPLGSLDQHLHDRSSEQKPLDWYTRMKVALGTAKGLEYLHHTANPPVIYRNLKPSNVLLDDDFNAKLSDFGLAKLGSVGAKPHISAAVRGTNGYIAPEYERTGILSVKADVYSFGVVLLELVSGLRAVDVTKGTKGQKFVSWANQKLKDPKKFTELADPSLEGNYPEMGLNQALEVASLCLKEEQSARPTMREVVTTLMHLSPDHGSGSAHTGLE